MLGLDTGCSLGSREKPTSLREQVYCPQPLSMFVMAGLKVLLQRSANTGLVCKGVGGGSSVLEMEGGKPPPTCPHVKLFRTWLLQSSDTMTRLVRAWRRNTLNNKIHTSHQTVSPSSPMSDGPSLQMLPSVLKAGL